LWFAFLAAQAQGPAMKTFHDARYGVTFQYPAQWISGPDAFHLGAEALRQTPDGGGPLGKVGFEVGQDGGPYPGAMLTGLQFAYDVIPRSSRDNCRKRLEEIYNTPSTPTTIRGVAYNHTSFEGAWTGHQVFLEIYSSFQNGHCYLFDEQINTISSEEAKPLSAAQWKQLRDELASVMQSVRIQPKRYSGSTIAISRKH